MATKKKTRKLPSNFPFKSVTVHVTAADIKKGKKFDTEKCPVTIACERALGLPCRACPDLREIWDTEKSDKWSDRINERLTFNGINSVLQFQMPVEVIEFIESFDDGDTVEPLTFVLTF